MLERRPRILLHPGREQSILRSHPWVFSGAVRRVDGEVFDGAVVEVFDSKGKFLCVGHYGLEGIAVRVLSLAPIENERDFLLGKLRAACERRGSLGLPSGHTDSYRLVNAEGDGLSGLVVDIYTDVIVLQLHSTGMKLWKELIVSCLEEIFNKGVKSFIDRSPGLKDERVGSLTASFKQEADKADCLPIISENGLKFKVNCNSGQKTGFFLDQRDNRQILKSYAQGRRVLNTFSYTGGFSIYALSGGASSVVSVDTSNEAIELLGENIKLNFDNLSKGINREIVTDCFDFLSESKEKFDIVIVDPPSFAKKQGARRGAITGYEKLNQLAMSRVDSCGFIFTFSCSQFVSKEEFRSAIYRAGLNAKRDIKLIKELGPASCHMTNFYHLEGSYLKGLLLLVE